MSQELIFYTNPMSRGRIVHWMLEELGVTYTTKIIEYGPAMKSNDYLAINPMGKVPAIKHGNTIVTESAAICAYLAETFSDKNLVPKTEKERGLYYRWMFFAAGPLEQALGFKNLDITIPEDKQRQLGCGNYKLTVDNLVKAVSDNPYIAGDRFTAADVYVGSHVGWAVQFGTLEKRPEFIKYWERVGSRPARTKADEINNALIKK